MNRLEKVLGGDETRWLVERVRSRLEQERPLTGTVTLGGATDEQRRAVEAIFGRRVGSGRSLTVSLDELDALVRHSGLHDGGLAGAVVALRGPVVVTAVARAERAAAWQTALMPLHSLGEQRAQLRPWVEGVAPGLVKRLGQTPDRAAGAVVATARLLAMVPVPGRLLGEVAAATTGSAHGLDRGQLVASLALSAIRHTWWVGSEHRRPRPRALWECVGIVTDELSSTVLTLNLPALPDAGPGLGRLLVAARECGDPVVLTLRQVSRSTLPFAPARVFVCENPAVVQAAADSYGIDCPAMVCTGGQPTVAALRLLDHLAAAGCPLWYHGDFDWGGVRIANLLCGRLPMRAWHFDTASLRSHVAKPTDAPREALLGDPVGAAWDPDLSAAIAAHGFRLEEEAVMAELLADLGAARAHDVSSGT